MKGLIKNKLYYLKIKWTCCFSKKTKIKVKDDKTL